MSRYGRILVAVAVWAVFGAVLPARRHAPPVLARPAAVWTTTARITWYDQGTTMADGNPVDVGAAACSTDLPFGTVVTFPDGWAVTCEDRGDLGDGSAYTWIDCYGADWLPAVYGDWATVTVEAS